MARTARHDWILPRIGAVALMLGSFTLLGAAVATKDVPGEKYLYVWADDQERTAPDFLAVVDFDASSPNYGHLITSVALPEPGQAGNEPHHVGLSADGKVLACGGLLSVLKGQKEVFFFDVS